jgi:hypothetical protein
MKTVTKWDTRNTPQNIKKLKIFIQALKIEEDPTYRYGRSSILTVIL